MDTRYDNHFLLFHQINSVFLWKLTRESFKHFGYATILITIDGTIKNVLCHPPKINIYFDNSEAAVDVLNMRLEASLFGWRIVGEIRNEKLFKHMEKFLCCSLCCILYKNLLFWNSFNKLI